MSETTVMQQWGSLGGLRSKIYRRAPASIRYKGSTYFRDAAKSDEEKVWYLAAASMVHPASMTALVPETHEVDGLSFYLDTVDRSALDDAQAQLAKAKAAYGKALAAEKGLKAHLKTRQDLLVRLQAEMAQAGDPGRQSPGDVVLGIFTGGIYNVGRYGLVSSKVGATQGEVDDLVTKVADAHSATEQAAADLQSAQETYASARQDYESQLAQQRAAEEQAAQQRLQDQLNAEQDAQAQADLQDQLAQAQSDASDRMATAQDVAVFYDFPYGDYGATGVYDPTESVGFSGGGVDAAIGDDELAIIDALAIDPTSDWVPAPTTPPTGFSVGGYTPGISMPPLVTIEGEIVPQAASKLTDFQDNATPQRRAVAYTEEPIWVYGKVPKAEATTDWLTIGALAIAGLILGGTIHV